MDLKDKSRLLAFLLLGVGVFNAMDFFLTTYVINQGHKELNPIIDAIIGTGYFPLLKLVLVPVLLLILWSCRGYMGKRLLPYAWLLFTAYASLMLYFRVKFI
jgi:L-cystine uptake protein TcyP (sodium:dicarboxylate symporter family)